jgi:16S rRNA (guanine527-N7)-methyltransferase
VNQPLYELRAVHEGAARLGVPCNEQQGRQLLQLLDELQQWSRSYNLTAITDRRQMLTHHLLDSLAARPFLCGTRIADVGTGAGFPGLPLAIVCPDLEFTLIDSTAKKIRFVEHAARTLGLGNVTAIHARIEALPTPLVFDTVIARAVAALPALVKSVQPLCDVHTRLVAMKGQLPKSELAALPAGWRLLHTARVEVPGLTAERHILTLAQGADRL